MILNSGLQAQTATVLLRPTHVDILDEDARGAVLINLSGYSTNDARYRLYSGSSQYRPWNFETESYVATNAYASGPRVPGTPSTTAIFWIAYIRGSNNRTVATYRDKLGPDYGPNHQTMDLPAATEIESDERFILAGSLTGSAGWPLSQKYVTLAFTGETLVSASHSDLTTGDFVIVCPDGTTITKVEVRTMLNEAVGEKTGSWTEDTDIEDIQLALLTDIRPVGVDDGIRLYPVPVGATLTIDGIEAFGTVEITDVAGRVLKSINSAGAVSIVVPTAGLGRGIYFVRLTSAGGVVVKRFIKQ